MQHNKVVASEGAPAAASSARRQPGSLRRATALQGPVDSTCQLGQQEEPEQEARSHQQPSGCSNAALQLASALATAARQLTGCARWPRGRLGSLADDWRCVHPSLLTELRVR